MSKKMETRAVEEVQEEKIPEEKKAATREGDIEDIPGVGKVAAEKLKEAGFGTMIAVAVASPSHISEAAGMGEAAARKIIHFARENLEMGFESAEDILIKRESLIKVTTGSSALDGLLGGGLESGSILENFGAYGSSKSQLAHQFVVNIQLPKEKGGAEGMAVFIDTEGTFRPERIKQMAQAVGLDSSETLKRIKVARAYNSDHQMLMAEKVEDLINNEKLPIKLIVVDSLTAHFRAEFLGRGTLAERQQKLNKHLHTLMKIADVYGIAVYVTNQVMSRPDVFFGDPTVPIGGNIVGHASTFRVYVRKGKGNTRVAKLIDAPNLPDAEAVFQVNEEGIRDI